MTYRTLLTSAAAISFLIGGIGVAFDSFAHDDPQDNYRDTARISYENGVNGSPLIGIKELLDVDFVMKGGVIYKNKE